MEIYTDFPERLKPGKNIYTGDAHQLMKISSLRPHNEGVLLGLEGIATPEQAGRYRNQIISIPISDAKILQDGEYYFHELISLTVIDESGRELGSITEIMETGANDVYVVTDQTGHELLIPATQEVVLDVDMVTKVMKVHLLPGLLDEEGEDS